MSGTIEKSSAVGNVAELREANNETVADIVAEMREYIGVPVLFAPMNAVWIDDFKALADRIEAAHKREVADALDTGAFVEAAHKREKATTEKSSAVGNAAKMREALEYAYDIWVKMYEYIEPLAQPHLLQVLADAGKMMETALAAPPRNCDLARDWLHDLYIKFKPPASVRREMPPEWVDAVMAFCRWLVKPVKEGGAE